MRRIYVGFSKAKGFKPASWAIRKIERTAFSHVYVRWWSESSESWIVYEATSSGVHFSSKKFFERNEIIEEFPFNLENPKALYKFCIDNLEREYAFKQMFGMLLQRILWLFKINIKAPFLDGGVHVLCYELISCLLNSLDIMPLVKEDSRLFDFYVAIRNASLSQTNTVPF